MRGLVGSQSGLVDGLVQEVGAEELCWRVVRMLVVLDLGIFGMRRLLLERLWMPMNPSRLVYVGEMSTARKVKVR